MMRPWEIDARNHRSTRSSAPRRRYSPQRQQPKRTRSSSSESTRKSLFEQNRDRLRAERDARNFQPYEYVTNSDFGVGSADGHERFGRSVEDREYWRAMREMNGVAPTPPAGGGSGGGRRGGRRGGGGGGGGVGGSAAASALASSLQAALNSRMFAHDPSMFDADRSRVTDAVAADRAAMNSAFDAVGADIDGMVDPFTFEVAATQQAPEYAAFLASQGVDPSAYMSSVVEANGEAEAAAVQARSMRDALAAAFAENQGSRRAEVGQARASGGSQLSAVERATMQAIDERERARKEALRQERNQIVMQLIAAMAENGQIANIDELLGGV